MLRFLSRIGNTIARPFVAAWRKVKAVWHFAVLAGALVSVLFLCRGPRHEEQLRLICDEDFRAAERFFNAGEFDIAALRFARHALYYPESPHRIEAYYMIALSQARYLRRKGGAHEVDFDLPLDYIELARAGGVDTERLDAALNEVAYGLYEVGSYERALAMFRAALERKKERVLLKLDIAYCLARLDPPRGDDALKEIAEFLKIMEKAESGQGIVRGLETKAAVLQELGRYQEAGDTLDELARGGELAVRMLETAGQAYLKEWASHPPEADRDKFLLKAKDNFVNMSIMAKAGNIFLQREFAARADFHIAATARRGKVGIDPVQVFTRLTESESTSPYLRYASALQLADLLIASRGQEIEGIRWLEKAFSLADAKMVADTSLASGAEMVRHLQQIREVSQSPELLAALVRAAMAAGRLLKADLALHRTTALASERLATLYRADALESERIGDRHHAGELRREANGLLVNAAMAYRRALALELPDAELDETLYKMGSVFFESGYYSRAIAPLVECGIDRARLYNQFAAPALILLGRAYVAQGEYVSARDVFEKCMTIAERTDYSRQTRYERARSYEIEGKYAYAVQAYEEIFKFGPQDGMSPEHAVWQDSLLALGRLHLELARKEREKGPTGGTASAPTVGTLARKHVERATELCEEAFERSETLGINRRFDSAYLLATCYMAFHEWDKAGRTLAVACSLVDRLESPGAAVNPSYASAQRRVFLLAADCSYMLGNHVRALDEYEEAERRADQGADRVLAIIGRARCFIELQRDHEARQTLERAMFCVERLEASQFPSPEFGKEYLRSLIDELQKKAG